MGDMGSMGKPGPLGRLARAFVNGTFVRKGDVAGRCRSGLPVFLLGLLGLV